MTAESSPVVLDTNIASNRFKRRPTARLTRLINTTSVITFVTYGELRKWARMRDRAPHNLTALTDWLDRTPVIDSDADISTAWGEPSAAGVKSWRTRPQNDTWIAACCLVYGLPLATPNVKDFRDFVDDYGLQLVTC